MTTRTCSPEVPEIATRVLGTEDALATSSGSAAVLAATAALARHGSAALVPGWMCLTVVNALILAGVRPLLADVNPDFTMSTQYRDNRSVGLVVYAPFGGHAPDMESWVRWAKTSNTPLLLDFSQVADLDLWHEASETKLLMVTSFREGKPLGGQGGGLVAGPGQAVEQARTFASGGYDSRGMKSGVGLDVRIARSQEPPAVRALLGIRDRTSAWRLATAREIEKDGLLEGWRPTGHALSRIPRPGRQGTTDLNPDATFRATGWQEAVSLRFPSAGEPVAELVRLKEMYEAIGITKVWPEGQ